MHKCLRSYYEKLAHVDELHYRRDGRRRALTEACRAFGRIAEERDYKVCAESASP